MAQRVGRPRRAGGVWAAACRLPGTVAGMRAPIQLDLHLPNFNYPLCSLKPGGHRRLLVRHGREPAWSPDGRRLALVGRDGVYIARPDGSALRRVTRMRPLSLDWQPLPQR